jgi:hypothetical protein
MANIFFLFFFLPNVCANLIYSIVLFAWPLLFYFICTAKQYTVHEAAICSNPPICSFTGNGKIWPILNGPTIKHVVFLRKHKDKNFFCFFCWQNFGKSVVLTQLYNKSGISVWRIEWVKGNCSFSSDTVKNFEYENLYSVFVFLSQVRIFSWKICSQTPSAFCLCSEILTINAKEIIVVFD